MKATKKNVEKVCKRLAKLCEQDMRLLATFNNWLDDLLNEDAFGTEGQLDPRGDHRK